MIEKLVAPVEGKAKAVVEEPEEPTPAVHYATSPGIPYCGEDVVEEEVNRQSRWRTEPVTRVAKRVFVEKGTTLHSGLVNCADCLSQMTIDGLI